MRFRALLGAVLVLFLLPTVVACGADTDSGAKTGVSDEEYLKVICTGLSNFTDALLSKTTAAEIGQVIKDYIAEMKKVDPPSDVKKFHDDFVKYLEDSLSEPTSLVTRKPPLPSESVRKRLAAKEPGVPECKSPTFFDAGP